MRLLLPPRIVLYGLAAFEWVTLTFYLFLKAFSRKFWENQNDSSTFFPVLAQHLHDSFIRGQFVVLELALLTRDRPTDWLTHGLLKEWEQWAPGIWPGANAKNVFPFEYLWKRALTTTTKEGRLLLLWLLLLLLLLGQGRSHVWGSEGSQARFKRGLYSFFHLSLLESSWVE